MVLPDPSLSIDDWKDGGTDDRFAEAAMEGFGAFILGRNMFGPAGDDWGGPDWKGWWGDNPPYHAPTYILTHHARAPIVMDGGTTFHFVTDGIEAALAQAKAAAGDLDVKIGGGVSTVRQYLLAGAIDELHLALSPVVLGRGESLFRRHRPAKPWLSGNGGGPHGVGDPPRADALTGQERDRTLWPFETHAREMSGVTVVETDEFLASKAQFLRCKRRTPTTPGTPQEHDC